MSIPLQCDKCYMTFRSASLLEKHKFKFCVGGLDGGTDEEMLRNLSPVGSGMGRLSAGYQASDFVQPYNLKPHEELQFQKLAHSHNQQMMHFQTRNLELERQRDDIRHQLDELSHQSATRRTTLFEKLKKQETDNEQILKKLKEQLAALNREWGEKRHVDASSYPGYQLLEEIRTLRQSYLDNDGRESSILNQMVSMEAEAKALCKQQQEDHSGTNAFANRRKVNVLSHQVQSYEIENDRLEHELNLIKQENLKVKRDSMTKDASIAQELKLLQQQHLKRMTLLQQETELLQHQAILERHKQELSEIATQKEHLIMQPHADTPWLMQGRYLPVYRDGDASAGFVLFYDFILGLDSWISACRLIAQVHSGTAGVSTPLMLPTVFTNTTHSLNSGVALLGSKQSIPRNSVCPNLNVIVEVQTASGPRTLYNSEYLTSQAWSKLKLSSDYGHVMTGRFRAPLKMIPVKPQVSMTDFYSLPQYCNAELFYRILNSHNVGASSSATVVSLSERDLYRYPHQAFYPQPLSFFPNNIPPPPTDPPPSSAHGGKSPHSFQKQYSSEQALDIGFIIDRVKHAEPKMGKVQLTAYRCTNGKVVQSSLCPVSFETACVKISFKHGYHVFGCHQEVFKHVEMQSDTLVIAKLFLSEKTDSSGKSTNEEKVNLLKKEILTAWAAIPMVTTVKQGKSYVNVGTHILKLYLPPAPAINHLSVSCENVLNGAVRYGNATLRIHIFQGDAHNGSLTPSECSEDEDDETIPESAWICVERKQPPSEPFMTRDGFDIYIDGCKFLPDSVTITRVAMRILDRKYNKCENDVSAIAKVDSDIFNPVYEHREEFREPHFPASATMLLKVYTIDRFQKQLTVVGFAVLNIFVESGSEKQPSVDRPGMQISLNEGAHQLRLYSKGPDGVVPLTESCLKDNGGKPLPCASILVRIVQALKDKDGNLLEAAKFPESSWKQLGLWKPRPLYTDGVYNSMSCLPWKGEVKVYCALMKRSVVSVKEAVNRLTHGKEKLHHNKSIEHYMRNQLTKSLDLKPLQQNMNKICQYDPKKGFMIAVDGAANLPWSKFTLGHVCLNPPGSFYASKFYSSFDKLVFIERLNLRSTNTSPIWADGYKHFPLRSFYPNLAAIIHLQEIVISVTEEAYRYSLSEQAWTVLQVFDGQYVFTEPFQLPLFYGAPSQSILQQLAEQPCREWISSSLKNNDIELVDGASVFVRLCDARREEELPAGVFDARKIPVNTSYLPAGRSDEYDKERAGKVLETMVPKGRKTSLFLEALAVKFRQAVVWLSSGTVYKTSNLPGYISCSTEQERRSLKTV